MPIDEFIAKNRENITVFLRNHSLGYDLFISIVGGVVASYLIWIFISSINPNKVYLCLRYAYGHSYEHATQDDPVRKISKTVPVRMYSGQKLYLAVLNTNINSIENCTLHLRFQDGLNIKTGEGWQVHLPNKDYTYMFYGSLNNILAFGANPLFIEFQSLEKNGYKVSYTITGKNMRSKTGHFFIEKSG